MKTPSCDDLNLRGARFTGRIVAMAIITLAILCAFPGCDGKDTPSDSAMDVDDGDDSSDSLGDIGDPCYEDSDCAVGICLVNPLGGERGSCYIPCSSNEDCIDESTDGYPRCCVSKIEGKYYCEKIRIGASCGTGDKICGESCTEQRQSACVGGLICSTGNLEVEATCSHFCATYQECSDCLDTTTSTYGLPCMPISDEIRLCIQLID